MTVVHSQFKLAFDRADLLQRASRAALETALNVQPNERVLIMSNPDGDLPLIATALYNAALDLLTRLAQVATEPVESRADEKVQTSERHENGRETSLSVSVSVR